MLTSLHIENLRGIERLDIEGLGRVNIIVGRNDVGKTTVLGAAGLQRGPQNWAFLVPHLADQFQDPADLEWVWQPVFRDGDWTRSPTVSGQSGALLSGWQLDVSRSAKTNRPEWPLILRQVPTLAETVELYWDEDGVISLPREESTTWWSPGSVEPEEMVFEALRKLYLAGRTGVVVDALRRVNPRIEAVELVAEHIYVRLAGAPVPLPYTILGDGARRILEFAVALAAEGDLILVDEAENGFHWTTLRTVWELFRAAAPGNQIFATTHRDELVRIACEVFRDAGDDGLRIIRLERDERGHRAVVYTPEVALAALDSGLEIRG